MFIMVTVGTIISKSPAQKVWRFESVPRHQTYSQSFDSGSKFLAVKFWLLTIKDLLK